MRLNILSMLFLNIGCCCAMTEKKEIKIKEFTYVPRGLLIFLDDSEEKKNQLGAVSNVLIAALYQDAGPIIASASLLRNIFSEDKTQAAKLVGKSAVQLFIEHENAGEHDASLKKAIYLKAFNFDPTKWIIKEISSFLYLLLPRTFLQSLNIDIFDVLAVNADPASISSTELQLGLKVNHMKRVSLLDIMAKIGKIATQDSHYFIKALYDENTKRSTIFCTRPEYYSHNKSQVPLWTMYMYGHGMVGHTIVGIALEDFKQALNFFANSINMRLLVYSSCYAAGLNTKTIYKDATSAIQKTYSFPIITQAITDASTFLVAPPIALKNGQLILKPFEQFSAFLKSITPETIDYRTLVEYLFPLIPKKEIREQEPGLWAQVPQIKLPGIEWFSVMAAQKEVVSIGSILAKTFDANKQLDVVKFFKTDPKALLLYAADIPFNLLIKSNNLEVIISMLPGDSIHTIKGVYSQKKIDEIIKWFTAIDMLNVRKIFYIEEINSPNNVVVNDVIIYNETIPVYSTTRSFSKHAWHAFYKDNFILYVQEGDKQSAEPATSEQIKKYKQLLIEVHHRIPKVDVAQTGVSGITTEDVEKLKKTLITRKTQDQLVQDLLTLQADFAQLFTVL